MDQDLKKWIELNKKDLLACYKEYLKDMLENYNDDIEYTLNFKDFCQY